MRLILWHGYLLEGTGSNIYTQHIARAWGRLGHDVVVVCQQLRAERFDLGPRVRVVRPDVGPLLPTFVLDRYEGIEARHVADLTAAELERYTAANIAAIRAEIATAPVDLVLANHAIMAGRWPRPRAGAARATPSRFTAPSSSTRSGAGRPSPTLPVTGSPALPPSTPGRSTSSR